MSFRSSVGLENTLEAADRERSEKQQGHPKKEQPSLLDVVFVEQPSPRETKDEMPYDELEQEHETQPEPADLKSFASMLRMEP